MKKDWRLHSKEIFFQDEHTVVERWRVSLPNGEEDSFTLVDARGDAVIVFGITADARILVLRQFFMSAQTYEYTLVAGILDGETPEETARKELREEAGAVASEFISLGSSLKGKWTLGHYHYYLARDVAEVGPQALEPAEDIAVEYLTQERFISLLRSGALQDVASMVCAYRALDYLKITTL